MIQESFKETHHPVSWRYKAGIAVSVATFLGFIFCVHPFLALNSPVSADTLIVEGWVPDYVLARAAQEFKGGHYTRIFVSGIFSDASQSAQKTNIDGTDAVRQLVGLGISASVIEACPTASASFNRTSHMARSVRDRMRALGVIPGGVNVFTLGPHARQSVLAYQRMLGGLSPVGVISIPKYDYNPSRWWASGAGIKKTTKDFAGWLKELIFGLRS